MDAILTALQSLAGDHQLQLAFLGIMVKLIVDQAKKAATGIDADGTKKYKVPVELMVTVFSGLAAVGEMYLHSQLSTFDPAAVSNFFLTTLPIYLNAMGIHLFCSNVKEKSVK